MARELFTSREIPSGYRDISLEGRLTNIAVILAGPNGVGKGTISGLLTADPALRLQKEVRYTSRPRSAVEIDGLDYHFVRSHEAFERLVESSKLIEYSSHPQGYYGTGRELIERVQTGQHNILVDVDARAALVLKEIFAQIGVPNIDILLSPVSRAGLEDTELISQVLRQRMLTRGRGETEAELENRLSYALDTYSSSDKFGFVVVNEEKKTDDAVTEIRRLIRSSNVSS